MLDKKENQLCRSSNVSSWFLWKKVINYTCKKESGSEWMEDGINRKNINKTKHDETTESQQHTFQSVCDVLDLSLSSDETLLNISRKWDTSAVLASANWSIYPARINHDELRKKTQIKQTNKIIVQILVLFHPQYQLKGIRECNHLLLQVLKKAKVDFWQAFWASHHL